MKKIIIIDGGPRKTFNTAPILKKFAEGASSVSDQIEVKCDRSDAYFLRASGIPLAFL